MPRRSLQSRLARYSITIQIDIVRLDPIQGQHIDIAVYFNITALFNQTSEIVVDGDLQQVALDRYTFRVYDPTLIIKAGYIVVYDSNRYQVISSKIKHAPQDELILTCAKIENRSDPL